MVFNCVDELDRKQRRRKWRDLVWVRHHLGHTHVRGGRMQVMQAFLARRVVLSAASESGAPRH